MSSSTNDCIKFMLDIKDKNIFFKDQYYKFTQGKKFKIFEAVLVQPACPFCGSIDLLHNGRYKTGIRYITANASFPVIIRLFKQRVLCRDCNHRSMAQTNLVKKYCFISNASKLKVLSALTEDRSMTSIAREHNVSVNTVQRVLASCSHRFLDGFDHLPEHLAFDEFKGVDRQLHFICLDGEKHEVIQILRTRYKKTLLKYFGRFSLEARENVKTVTMDLNFYYQGIVRACFLNAKIVIDRFHMVQMLTRSFNSLRVKVMKQFKKNTRSYQLLKAPWKLYLKNHDKQALKELINSKEPVGELMHKTLITFRKNGQAILNGTTSIYSNGCLEGFNRKIKQIERTAYGYSNYINLLTRIRLEENKVKEKEPSNLLIA